MKIREGVLRVAAGLAVAGIIASQMPGINSIAFATPHCSPVFISDSNDADKPALGLKPKDLMYTALGTLAVVGVVSTVTHGSGGSSASTQTVSPTAPQQVRADHTVAPIVAGTAR